MALMEAGKHSEHLDKCLLACPSLCCRPQPLVPRRLGPHRYSSAYIISTHESTEPPMIQRRDGLLLGRSVLCPVRRLARSVRMRGRVRQRPNCPRNVGSWGLQLHPPDLSGPLPLINFRPVLVQGVAHLEGHHVGGRGPGGGRRAARLAAGRPHPRHALLETPTPSESARVRHGGERAGCSQRRRPSRRRT